MTKKELCSLYAGLFEEVFEKDPDIIEKDNFEDYRCVIRELNKINGTWPRNTVLDQLREIESELPFD